MKSIRCFLICCCVLLFAACEKSEPVPDVNKEPVPEVNKKPLPDVNKIPDPLAFGNVNQFIVKGPDWKQIVKDKTQFVLGEADSEPYETSNGSGWNTTYIRYKQSYLSVSFFCIKMNYGVILRNPFSSSIYIFNTSTYSKIV